MNNENESNYSVRDFTPLILIFSIIILSTLIKQLVSQAHDINSLMSDFMGIFFITFGTFKIINLKNFTEAYATYDLIAKQSSLYAFMYPFIELTLGIFYFMHWQNLFINAIALAIMLIGATGVALELSKGSHIVCACLGTVFRLPMTYVTLLEDLLMALLAFIALFF